MNSPQLETLRNKSFLWRCCRYVAVKNIQMELLEVVKYSILLPSQNIPQRLAKGIASFLEIFNSPDCTPKKNSVWSTLYSWISRGQNIGKMRSLLFVSLLRESGEHPAHLVQLDVLLRDLVLQPSRVTVDCSIATSISFPICFFIAVLSLWIWYFKTQPIWTCRVAPQSSSVWCSLSYPPDGNNW